MIWKFTDNKQFSKFDKQWYNDIIELSNKYKISDSGTIKINDTHEVVFDFKVFVANHLIILIFQSFAPPFIKFS